MFTKTKKTKKMTKDNQQAYKQLNEGLEAGDLSRLIDPLVTVDEYKSKIGTDDEIVVLKFNVQGREPALDLVSFIEKSYDWVLDADASSGELNDGSYAVFVEADREPELAEKFYQMFKDLVPLADMDLALWQVEYAKPRRRSKVSVEELRSLIPGTPNEYRKLKKVETEDIDKLKAAAGVAVSTTAPKNDFTEGIRTLAGIR